MKSSLLVIDNLDDRKTIWQLLHRLPPPKRLRYLHRACAAVADVLGNGLKPMEFEGMVEDALRCDRGDDRLTNAIYVDLLNLAANVKLDMMQVALDLERIAKGSVWPLKEARLKTR